MFPNFSSWLQTALDFVFPAECQHCREFLGDDRVVIFCRACWESIPIISGQMCSQCGQPYPSTPLSRHLSHVFCSTCRVSTPFFERAFAAAYYEDILKEAIHQFKFCQKIALGRPLAQFLVTQLPQDLDPQNYQAVLPVPLHRTRQRQRGYNQSAILAKEIASHFQLPLMLNNLRRIRPTDSQALVKGHKARQENVKNAFQVISPEKVCEKQVILIDDVMTTGATVNECARILKNAGTKSVLVLVLSQPAVHGLS